jgi:hypothetical protein
VHLVADPPPGVELVQYLAWYLVYGRMCIEVMAQLVGVELQPIELPKPVSTRHSAAHAALVGMLAPTPGADPIQAYQTRTAERVAHALARADLFGPALEAQNLDEVGALLGRRPHSWSDADERLESFVQGTGPESDAALVGYFYRHFARQEALLQGALRELEGVEIERLD